MRRIPAKSQKTTTLELIRPYFKIRCSASIIHTSFTRSIMSKTTTNRNNSIPACKKKLRTWRVSDRRPKAVIAEVLAAVRVEVRIVTRALLKKVHCPLSLQIKTTAMLRPALTNLSSRFLDFQLKTAVVKSPSPC
jgi:hypothetical protein